MVNCNTGYHTSTKKPRIYAAPIRWRVIGAVRQPLLRRPEIVGFTATKPQRTKPQHWHVWRGWTILRVLLVAGAQAPVPSGYSPVE
jgi:hypothetical protein